MQTLHVATATALQIISTSSTIETMSRRIIGWSGALLLIAGYFFSMPVAVHADSLQSPNYRFDESVIGTGGLFDSSSANYKASSATGDIGVGNSTSSNYQVDAGSKTSPDPTLSFSVNSPSVDLGNFTASASTVTTANFSVANYTSYGYAVQILGNPPTNGTHTITPMAATGAPQAGVEQFGVNLVANTLPSSVGANPNNGQFGFGAASPNYSTSNRYRYVSGETIALAAKSSGTTTYTISYLVNVASLTPGGKYTSDQTIIVTGTY
jgi:hypothetical protein